MLGDVFLHILLTSTSVLGKKPCLDPKQQNLILLNLYCQHLVQALRHGLHFHVVGAQESYIYGTEEEALLWYRQTQQLETVLFVWE